MSAETLVVGEALFAFVFMLVTILVSYRAATRTTR